MSFMSSHSLDHLYTGTTLELLTLGRHERPAVKRLELSAATSRVARAALFRKRQTSVKQFQRLPVSITRTCLSATKLVSEPTIPTRLAQSLLDDFAIG
jgi:hypothetical protein